MSRVRADSVIEIRQNLVGGASFFLSEGGFVCLALILVVLVNGRMSQRRTN